jgi:hypothetical protein
MFLQIGRSARVQQIMAASPGRPRPVLFVPGCHSKVVVETDLVYQSV